MDQTTMNMAYDDVVDAFKSGTVDTVNAGTQRAATIMTSNFADNFTSCPIPGGKEGGISTGICGRTNTCNWQYQESGSNNGFHQILFV